MIKENMYEGRDIEIILDERRIEGYLIKEFQVRGEINSHKKLEIQIEIGKEMKKNLENIISKEVTEIMINLGEYKEKTEETEKAEENRKKEEKNIFKGIVDYFEVIEYGNEGYVIILEAYSRSILMDREWERKYRVFQDVSMTYEDIVTEINKDYRGMKFQINSYDKAEVPIGRLIVQYNETDWEFLVRIASHLGTGLITTETGIITFGIINMGNVKNEDKYFSDYSITRDLKKLYYKVYSGRVISLGDTVSIESQENMGENFLIVLKSKIFLKNNLLKSEFQATDVGNYTILKKYNSRIKGCCIEGQVEKVLKEGEIAKMEVIFYEGLKKIAELKNGGDYEMIYPDYGIKRFPLSYQTFYSQTNTGFFCTPEVNDTVEVYFPSDDEGMAKVSWAVNNKGNGRFSNYEKRNFHINGNDFNLVIDKDKMELNMEESYRRTSKTSTETAESSVNKGIKNMVVVSDNYLGLESIGEMDIYGSNIDIIGKEKDIRMETPGEIRIKGSKVHNN